MLITSHGVDFLLFRIPGTPSSGRRRPSRPRCYLQGTPLFPPLFSASLRGGVLNVIPRQRLIFGWQWVFCLRFFFLIWRTPYFGSLNCYGVVSEGYCTEICKAQDWWKSLRFVIYWLGKRIVQIVESNQVISHWSYKSGTVPLRTATVTQVGQPLTKIWH